MPLLAKEKKKTREFTVLSVHRYTRNKSRYLPDASDTYLLSFNFALLFKGFGTTVRVIEN